MNEFCFFLAPTKSVYDKVKYYSTVKKSQESLCIFLLFNLVASFFKYVFFLLMLLLEQRTDETQHTHIVFLKRALRCEFLNIYDLMTVSSIHFLCSNA